MATYTSNYQLHQWVPEDDFLRTDFNEDFQKIDAGIAAALTTAQGKQEIVTGTFAGNTATQVINLGFQPKAVLVEDAHGQRDLANTYGGLILQGAPLTGRSGGVAGVITAEGFQVNYNMNSKIYINAGGFTYHYLAVR